MPSFIDRTQKWLSLVIAIIAIIAGVASFINSQASKAVVNYKVEQNEIKIEKLEGRTEYIPVIRNDMQNVADDVSEIKSDIKDLARAFNDYIQTH